MNTDEQPEPFISKVSPFLSDKAMEDKYIKFRDELGFDLQVNVEGFYFHIYGNRISIPFHLVRSRIGIIDIVIIQAFEAGIKLGREVVQADIKKALGL